MNDIDYDIENLTDEELIQFIDETNSDYDNWNINLDNIINNLQDNNKIFLSDISDNYGDKIFYMIYGYLDSDSLLDYDEITNGGISEFIAELNENETLQFIELLVDFKKQDIELVENDINFEKIISKLKRDVATLKKKLAQPNKYINTKQFEERYGLTKIQQKRLRSKINDPLPYTMPNNKTILYDPIEIEKWLENYKGRMNISDI